MKTRPAPAETRAAAINGHAPTAPATVVLRERSTVRVLVVAQISQLIYAPGPRNPHQPDSPWYVRCGGQELGISASSAATIASALHLNLTDLCSELS
jgi:hypothetical protein